MHFMFGSKALLTSLYIQKSNAGFFTYVDSSLLPTILESTFVLSIVVSSSYSASVHTVESLSMIMECSSRNDVGSSLSTCSFLIGIVATSTVVASYVDGVKIDAVKKFSVLIFVYCFELGTSNLF